MSTKSNYEHANIFVANEWHFKKITGNANTVFWLKMWVVEMPVALPVPGR